MFPDVIVCLTRICMSLLEAFVVWVLSIVDTHKCREPVADRFDKSAKLSEAGEIGALNMVMTYESLYKLNLGDTCVFDWFWWLQVLKHEK